MELFLLIYDSLTGELLDPIVGVPNAFAQGSYCENQYRLICEAYERLRERLGVVDEDSDVEQIIDEFLGIQRYLCKEMFAIRNHLI